LRIDVKSGNQSVDRAALILKTLSRHGALGVTEITRLVGLPKSITYRLLSSLKGADLVRVEPDRRRYMLGYGLLQITAKLLSGIEVRDLALPMLRQLRHETHETGVGGRP
jgi:IclR family acetate operon transcriptional repressor